MQKHTAGKGDHERDRRPQVSPIDVRSRRWHAAQHLGSVARIQEAMKGEDTAIVEHGSQLLKQRVPLPTRPSIPRGDRHAREEWLNTKPRHYALFVDRDTGLIDRIEAVTSETDRERIQFYDRHDPYIGLRLIVSPSLRSTDDGTGLKADLSIDLRGPARPGAEEQFRPLADCIDDEWLSPRAALNILCAVEFHRVGLNVSAPT